MLLLYRASSYNIMDCLPYSSTVSSNYWGEPHHVRSTVKCVFLLACMFVQIHHVHVVN